MSDSCLFASWASTYAASDNQCSAVVCRSDCKELPFPQGAPIYNTVEEALHGMPTNCGQTEAYSIVIKSGHEESSNIAVPFAVRNLSISVASATQALQTNLGALVQEASSDNANSSFVLTLSGVSWYPRSGNHSCLKLQEQASRSVQLSLSDVKVHCQLTNLTISEAIFSDVTAACPSRPILGNEVHTFYAVEYDGRSSEIDAPVECPTWNLNTLEHASINFYNSTIAPKVIIDLVDTTNLTIASTNFKGVLNAVISGVRCYFDVRESSFGDMLFINASSVLSELLLDRTTEEYDTHVFMRSNHFINGALFMAPYFDLDIQENFFSTVEVPGLIPSPNLWLNASSSAVGFLTHNTFLNGTAYLIIPASTIKPLEECTNIINSYTKLRIRANQFPPHSVNASLTVFWATDCKISSSHFQKLVIDANHNWWGHAGGPKLCCNPDGEGGYTSQFIQPDHWCTDSECRNFAKETLAEQCVTRCCAPDMRAGRQTTLIAIGVLTHLLLFAGIIVVTVFVRRNYGAAAFQTGNRTDLINKLAPILGMSLVISTLAAIGVLGIAGILSIPYWTDHNLPRQSSIQMIGVLASLIFAFDVLMQLIANSFLTVAILKRDKWPRFIKFFSSKIFIANCINVVYILTWAVIWITYVATEPPVCYSPKTRFYAFNISFGNIVGFDTNLTHMYALALVPIALFSIIVIIPQNALNQVLYHFEYVCINTAVETTLGQDLLKSPKLSREGKRLRIVAFFPFSFCFTLMAMCLYSIIKTPEVPLSAAMNHASLLVWGFPRFANTLGCAFAGAVASALAIFVSFSYNRPTLISVLTYISAIVSIAIADFNLAEIIAAAALPSSDVKKAFVLHGSYQIVGNITIIFLIVLAVLLYKLGNNVTSTIPNLARNNLNQHLDRAWLSHNSQEYASAYLTEDAYSPLINSDHDY